MSSQHNITIIAGLSGVGKTYVIDKLMNDSDAYKHFSAGSLIKKRRSGLNRDQLRELDKGSILDNQYLLVEQFNEEIRALNNRSSILFDAHMIIDNDENIIEVPYEIFKRLSPTRFVFLFDSPKKIITQRQNDKKRKRPIRTIAEITEQQNMSIILAQEYSRRLSIPFIQIMAGDIAMLSKFLFL